MIDIADNAFIRSSFPHCFLALKIHETHGKSFPVSTNTASAEQKASISHVLL